MTDRASATPLVPRSHLFRRTPELEPHGNWLSRHRMLGWPDTIITNAVVPWIPRVLLLATGIAVTVSAPGITGWRPYPWVLAVLVITGSWQEFWQRWDMTALWRRLLAFGVQLALATVLILLNPLGCILAFAGYTYAAALFTGWPTLIGTVLTAAAVAIGQAGGWRVVLVFPALYWILVGVNSVIATAFLALDARREEAVAQRDRTLHELLAAQQRNQDLQERLVLRARESGVQQERARLARELHDTVAQGFVAVVAQLEALREDDILTAAAQQRIQHAKTLAREGLGEARRAVNALRPIALDHRTVSAAIQALLGDWSAVHGIRARLQISGEPRATGQDATLVRVAQEALANVARHSGASAVTVTLTFIDDEVLLDISDNGTGFDPRQPTVPGTAGGHGLIGMAERVGLAGGRLEVESEPGAGTVISAAVPG